MSYNNDEQARRARAAQNAQWASNSSQPQNPSPYQTGTFSNPDEPIIHTSGTVPMDLLNSPSSHSIPGLPHNPAPLPMTYQNPNRPQDLRRQAFERETFNQVASSRGPPDVGYSAQPPNNYPQAPQNPGPGPSGSQSGPSYNPGGPQPISYQGKKTDLERERLRNNVCPRGDGRPLVPGKLNCQECLAANAERLKAYRRRLKGEEGK